MALKNKTSAPVVKTPPSTESETAVEGASPLNEAVSSLSLLTTSENASVPVDTEGGKTPTSNQPQFILENTLQEITPLLKFYELPDSETWSLEKSLEKLEEAMLLSQKTSKSLITELFTGKKLWSSKKSVAAGFKQYQIIESIQAAIPGFAESGECAIHIDPRPLLIGIAQVIDTHYYSDVNLKTLVISDGKDIELQLLFTDIFSLKKNPFIPLNWRVLYKPSVRSTGAILKSTTDAIKVLIRYLSTNPKHLSKSLPIPKVEGYLQSFIAPIHKLNLTEKQTLTQDTSCGVCHKKNGKQCKACMTIRYCSRECQKIDWPSHKLICRPLDSVEYIEIKVQDLSKDGNVSMLLSVHEDLGKLTQTEKKVVPKEESKLADVSVKKFIIKAQAAGSNGPILLYDKKKAFEALVHPYTTGHSKLFTEISKNVKFDGRKHYFWAQVSALDTLKIWLFTPMSEEQIW